MPEKQNIRERMRALRQSLSPEDVRRDSRAVADIVLSHPSVVTSRVLCTYAGVGKEIRTDRIMDSLLQAGHRLVVPDWEGWKQGHGIRLVEILDRQELLVENRIVPQPPESAERAVPADAVDLFLVPGLAFDESNNRLGMGGGFYDRLLALAKPEAHFIGLAYEFQVLSRIPVDAHDIPMQQVISPARGAAGRDRHKRRA